jgi:hypothetical protein
VSWNIAPAAARPDEALASAGRRRRLTAIAAGGDVRPRRRADAEADDEIQVQADEAEDQPGNREHVQGVELAQRIRAYLLAAG